MMFMVYSHAYICIFYSHIWEFFTKYFSRGSFFFSILLVQIKTSKGTIIDQIIGIFESLLIVVKSSLIVFNMSYSDITEENDLSNQSSLEETVICHVTGESLRKSEALTCGICNKYYQEDERASCDNCDLWGCSYCLQFPDDFHDVECKICNNATCFGPESHWDLHRGVCERCLGEQKEGNSCARPRPSCSPSGLFYKCSGCDFKFCEKHLEDEHEEWECEGHIPPPNKVCDERNSRKKSAEYI